MAYNVLVELIENPHLLILFYY